MTDIQVFAPVYRGALGIDAINARLRQALNAGGKPVLGGRLRIGDKLMLSGRNLHELGLMNGTVLRLLEHDEAAEALLVEADGMTIALPEDEAPRLQLAYACSVHKGQGIELPVALLVAHPAAGARFLRREMLYTAMTRARRATLVIGRRDVVARAAATPDTSRRHSRLVARLEPPSTMTTGGRRARGSPSVDARGDGTSTASGHAASAAFNRPPSTRDAVRGELLVIWTYNSTRTGCGPS